MRASDDAASDAIAAALLARALSCTESVARLCLNDQGREALVLTRVLFELMVDIHWEHANRTVVADLFLRHARLLHHRDRELAKDYPDIFGDASEPALDPIELRELEREFGRYGERGWTGKTLKERLRDIRDQFAAGDLDTYYEAIVRLINREVHPSSWSLARDVRVVQSSDESRRIQIRTADPELAGEVPGLTWWCLGHSLAVARERFAVTDSDFGDAQQAGAELLQVPRRPQADAE